MTTTGKLAYFISSTVLVLGLCSLFQGEINSNNTIQGIAWVLGFSWFISLCWVFGDAPIVTSLNVVNNETIVYAGVSPEDYQAAIVSAVEAGYKMAEASYEKMLDRQEAAYERQLNRMTELYNKHNEITRQWIDYLFNLLPQGNREGFQVAFNHPDVTPKFQVVEGEYRPILTRDSEIIGVLTTEEAQLWSFLEHGKPLKALPLPGAAQ